MNDESTDLKDSPQLYHLPYDYDGRNEKKPRSKKRFIGWILGVLILSLLCGRILFSPSENETPHTDQSAASAASDAEIAATLQEIQQYITAAYSEGADCASIAGDAASYIPSLSQRYYLSRLSDDPENASVLAAACKIYRSAENFSEKCQFPAGVTPETAFQALDLLEYDCPELFQLDFFHTDTYYSDPQTDQISSLELSYQMTKEEYALRLDACENVIGSVCEQADGLSDYEKELLVFDTLTSIYHYDDQSQLAGTAYGALCEGRAKCDGIAFAATWLLRELGLSCMSVGGYSDREEFGHAWNLFEIDGNYYALDLTQDIPLLDSDDPILHTGFNVPNRLVLHSDGINYTLDTSISDFFELPATDCIDDDYYVRNGLYVPAGSDYTELFYRLMDEAVTESGFFSVRFASSDELAQCYHDFDAFVDNWYESRDILSLEYSYSVASFNVFYAELQPGE